MYSTHLLLCSTLYNCSGHKANAVSKNQNLSGNDFKDFASFNGCFYHLGIAFGNVIFTPLESSLPDFSTGIGLCKVI